MTLRARLPLAFVWLLSVVAVAATVKAQDYRFRRLREPRVITGEDFGFRLDGAVGDQPAGTMVLRLNGRWVEPAAAPPLASRPATQ